MADEVNAANVTENRVSCSCRGTCSLKQGRNTNRGCPCKTSTVHCGAHCSCGSKKKPCRNKATESTELDATNFHPHNSIERPSEEEEIVKENTDVKEFINTLDEPMVRTLCIRSLRRGVGSMEHIHGLLIMEDDLDEESTPEADSEGPPSPQIPVADPEAVPWCRCGRCQIMPQEIENKCCGQRRCVTTLTRFAKLCLDPDVLQVAIRNRADIRNDRDNNSTRAFRKASYRQYVLDRYGYLGKGNRKVCPSCVVICIRQHYPSPTGVYMGFKPA